MKMKRIAASAMLAAILLPTSLSLSAMAESDGPGSPEKDERPHIEAHHESVEGIQFAVLGGAVVIAIGLAFKVGQTRATRKLEKKNEGN